MAMSRPQQLERPRRDIAVLAVDLGQGGEGEPVGILGVPALQFFDFARGHRVPVSRSEQP